MKGRIAFVLALFALSAGAGCGGSSDGPGSTTSQSSTLSTFRNAFLEFRYPQVWKTLQFGKSGELHFHPMLYLSTQAGHDPCRQTGLSVTCGWPVDHLQPGGVIAQWENRGYPGWLLSRQPGPHLTVGGRPAREQTARPGDCGTIGAAETVSVQIARPLDANWTAFTACLRGPNLAGHEREIKALLASTRFLQP
jgi:hypothetical protein